MKKVLVTLALVLTIATFAVAQQPAQPCPTGQKTIKDPGEYNEYMAALGQQDPGQKAAQMDAFVKKYPQSIVKCDALEIALADYQRAGKMDKAVGTANDLLAINPDHYRALLVVAYTKRAQAAQQTDPKQALALATEGQTAAEHALQVLPNAPLPEGVTKEEFDKQKAAIEPILQGVIAFALLQKKDYAGARDHYLKSDLNDLQNAYQLSLCELEMTPIDLNGFWHVVKAAKLAEAQGNTAGAQQIANYGKQKYKKYHGNTDGWDDFVKAAAAQTALPPRADLEKAITRAPTPCEIAVQAVNDAVKNNTLKELSFADREFVLQQEGCGPENKAAADKVWQYIVQDLQKNGEVRLTLPDVKVISATTESVDVAITEDNQKENKADLHVILEKPVAKPPEPGSTTNVTGVFSSYKADPFMFTMEKGELPPPPKPKVTPRKAPPKKPVTKKKK